jgi:hypothetical protein
LTTFWNLFKDVKHIAVFDNNLMARGWRTICPVINLVDDEYQEGLV